MSIGEFLKRLADLVLVSEKGTASWVEIPRLRRLWYIECSLWGALMVLTFLSVCWREYAASSETLALAHRIACFSVLMSLIASLATLTLEYFKYALKRQEIIRLDNVLIFYVQSVFLFGLLYVYLWLLYPISFSSPVFPVEHSPYILGGIGFFRMKMDFAMYSALRTLGGSFKGIEANTVVSATLIWLQGIYTTSLVALLIASYVNQNFASPSQQVNEQTTEQEDR